jgi:TRAP-type C4-dicarboxylate transport system permease small subunit
MLMAIADMLAGVFLRYVMTKISAAFDLPSIRFFWVEEIGEWSLAWLTFIGAAIGIRRGTHFAVQIITERLRPGLRRAVYTAHYVLVAAFGAALAFFGWQVAELNSQSFSPALDLNLRWLYLSAVVGGVLIVVYSVATIGDVWRGRIPGAGGVGED